MATQRRVTLTQLIGKSAVNAKSEFAGVNSYPDVGLQIETSAVLSGGVIALRQTADNGAYNGQIIAEIAFPIADGTTFAATSVAVSNIGTVVYAEITTALVGGTITKAFLTMQED